MTDAEFRHVMMRWEAATKGMATVPIRRGPRRKPKPNPTPPPAN